MATVVVIQDEDIYNGDIHSSTVFYKHFKPSQTWSSLLITLHLLFSICFGSMRTKL